MNSSLLPSKILILLVAACLGWIALLSLIFVIALGTGIATGWIVAGALTFAVAVWAIVMRREFHQSIAAPTHSEIDLDPACAVQAQARPSSFRRLAGLFSERSSVESSPTRRVRCMNRNQSLPRKNVSWRKSSPHRSTVR